MASFYQVFRSSLKGSPYGRGKKAEPGWNAAAGKHPHRSETFGKHRRPKRKSTYRPALKARRSRPSLAEMRAQSLDNGDRHRLRLPVRQLAPSLKRRPARPENPEGASSGKCISVRPKAAEPAPFGRNGYEAAEAGASRPPRLPPVGRCLPPCLRGRSRPGTEKDGNSPRIDPSTAAKLPLTKKGRSLCDLPCQFREIRGRQDLSSRLLKASPSSSKPGFPRRANMFRL